MRYKPSDKVRIKSLDWYNKNKTIHGDIWLDNAVFVRGQSLYCGCELTIRLVTDDCYYVIENDYYWTDEMIEGLVEEETKPKKDISLTQEQINTMVHDSCVLFCKHCGCGIPRETCTSLGTCKEHDEYRDTIRTHLMEKKKKGYPKTYEECCNVLFLKEDGRLYTKGYKASLIQNFQKLLICRDAYWKIAGEEMGLGRPWEPNWNDDNLKPCIGTASNEIIKCTSYSDNAILTFPTDEMLDAFYENFKEDIEKCKELL